MSAELPAGYSDPMEYLVDLFFLAYAPPALMTEDETRRGSWKTTPEGIAAIQQCIADDLRADLPDYMRDSLRDYASAATQTVKEQP